MDRTPRAIGGPLGDGGADPGEVVPGPGAVVRQVDLGLRYQPAGTQMQLAAALYNIEKTNVLTTDPVNPGFQVQTGKVRHRGLELEARGQLTEAISLIAGYSVTPTCASRWMLPRLPAFTAAWPDIDLRVLASERLVRFHHEGVDLAVRYGWDDYSVALNVTNLFDKEYYSTCSVAGYGCAQGEGREATLTLSRAF